MPLNVSGKDKSILVVDEDSFFGNTICSSLSTFGYHADFSRSAAEALARLERSRYDLVISDSLSISEVREWLNSGWRKSEEYVPVILSLQEQEELPPLGLDACADEYIHKPLRIHEMILRVTNLLRVRQLHQKLREQKKILQSWSRDLDEIMLKQDGHLSRLRKFVSPQLAQVLLSESPVDPLGVHRRNVSVMFVDLKGFTAFSEEEEPEEVREVLEQFYSTVGEAALRHHGTIGNFVGDAVMAFFNDPVEVSDHQLRAVKAAIDIREELRKKIAHWQERGHRLGYGLGLAEGYATIGGLGFQEFKTYTVIGTVTNLAARFCDDASDGDVVTSHRFFARVENHVHGEERGELVPHGIPYSIKSYRIVSLKEEPALQMSGAGGDLNQRP